MYTFYASATLAIFFNGVLAIDASNSAGYQKIADRLMNAINISVNPCENFYEFVCGGWRAAHPVPPNAPASSGYIKTIYDIKRDHIKKHLFDHFENIDPSDTTVPRTVRQAKLVLDGCKAHQNTADWLQVLQLFDSYGGWPVLRHSWKYEQFETQWTLEGLAGHIASHYVTTNDSSAFWVGSTRFVDHRHILTIQPGPEFRGPPKFSKAQFIDTAQAIARAAGITVADHQIMEDADQVEHVTVRLAAIFHDAHTPPLSQHMTIDQAQARWPYINWQTYFSKLAEDTIPLATIVDQGFEAEIPNYFDKLKDVYPTVDHRAAHNLLLYQIALASRLALYNTTLTDISNDRLSSTHEPDERPMLPEPAPEPFVPSSQMTLKEKCQKIIETQMKPATYLIFTMNHAPQWGLAMRETKRIRDGVLRSWKQMILDTPWLKAGAHSSALTKIDSVNFTEYGFDPRMFDENVMLTLYGGLRLEISDGSVLRKLKFGRFKQWQQFQRVLNRPEVRFKDPLIVNAFYSVHKNTIRLPGGGMLSDPFFEYGFPKATNYGGLGFTVGHEMGHGFDPFGIHHGHHGESSHWVDSSIHGFNQMKSCMDAKYNHYCHSQGGHTKCIHAQSSAPDNMADNSGIVAAFRAYKARITQDGLEPRLPGVMGRYTMEQVFFMSYGYTWCLSTNANWFGTDWPHRSHAPGDARVIVPEMNFVDFHETFNCPVGSHMHPKKACRVWH